MRRIFIKTKSKSYFRELVGTLQLDLPYGRLLQFEVERDTFKILSTLRQVYEATLGCIPDATVRHGTFAATAAVLAAWSSAVVVEASLRRWIYACAYKSRLRKLFIRPQTLSAANSVRALSLATTTDLFEGINKFPINAHSGVL